MALKIVTDGKAVTVFANEKEGQNGGKYTTYCIGVSSKDKDGNWVNGFIDCNFKKGCAPENKSKINISNAFYTVREYNGKKYTSLFVLDYTVEGEAPQANGTDFVNIADMVNEELPFN